MEIADLPLPPGLAARYIESGITKLYPPQEACVEAGLFSGKNLLIARDGDAPPGGKWR